MRHGESKVSSKVPPAAFQRVACRALLAPKHSRALLQPRNPHAFAGNACASPPLQAHREGGGEEPIHHKWPLPERDRTRRSNKRGGRMRFHQRGSTEQCFLLGWVARRMDRTRRGGQRSLVYRPGNKPSHAGGPRPLSALRSLDGCET